MSMGNRRLLLLSSSALMLLCFARVASSQAPEAPPATSAPETPAAAPQTPAATPQTPAAEAPAQQGAQPETPPAGAAPTVTVPQVTVEAPKPRPAARSFSARMSPSAECGHCHVRRPRRPKRRASATGLEVPAAPERRTTAGCRPLLEYRTPADWSGASGQTDDAEALCELRPCVRRRANSSPPPRP
jgi:hypothetical protein